MKLSPTQEAVLLRLIFDFAEESEKKQIVMESFYLEKGFPALDTPTEEILPVVETPSVEETPSTPLEEKVVFHRDGTLPPLESYLNDPKRRVRQPPPPDRVPIKAIPIAEAARSLLQHALTNGFTYEMIRHILVGHANWPGVQKRLNLQTLEEFTNKGYIFVSIENKWRSHLREGLCVAVVEILRSFFPKWEYPNLDSIISEVNKQNK